MDVHGCERGGRDRGGYKLEPLEKGIWGGNVPFSNRWCSMGIPKGHLNEFLLRGCQ